MTKPYRIGLFIAEHIERSRDFLFGAYRYAGSLRHLHLVRVSSTRKKKEDQERIRSGEFDGIIYPMVGGELLEWIQENGLPCISYHRNAQAEGVASVCVDDLAVGRMAADYFLQMHLKHFAFTGTSQTQYSNFRRDGFRERLLEKGYELSERELYGNTPDLETWLLALPRPCGLLASWDRDAAFVSRVIQNLGLRVPEDIAVMGTDNDRLECQSVYPPLSTIEFPSEKLGFEAMRRMDLQLQGDPRGKETLVLPPLRVVERQSTRISLIEHPQLQKALRFIQENSDQPIRVPEVCQHAAVNRRSLESLFRKHLNRSILDQIQEQHILRAQELLLRPELPIKAVASLSGFNSSSRFCKVFEQIRGCLPSTYRQQRTILSPE